MESIVIELQREAISSSSNISDLLRKALFVARKLKVKEFEKWINQELNGYNCPAKDIPEYRQVVGSLVWFNPVHGWIPAVIHDQEFSEMVKRTKLAESVPELLDLITAEKGHGLAVQLNQSQQNILSNLFKEHLSEIGLYGSAQFRLNFGKSQAQGIIDKVRNIVLDWTLKFEEDGILGEESRFTGNEKQKTSIQEPIKNEYTIHFHGNASGIQFQQNSPNSTQTMTNGVDVGQISDFISNLEEYLNEVGLPEKQQSVVESEVEKISTELVSSQPQPSVIKQSLHSIRTILEGAGVNLITSGLMLMIDKIHF
ncbi:hypothetical protein ACFVSS_16770 [Peribacillus butanolivorans]|uniref:AbiTii domain-containing protein n=1 Tax=Peribacillus butanolivorans TaxID=421767 RepID=UPI0036DAE9CD